jgi:phage-related baseplate assembly protein
MTDGTIASSEIKESVLEACNPDTVRPLTDYVVVGDPTVATYDISFTYYIPSDTDKPSSEFESAVQSAVAQYIQWQSAKLGRDVNPSYLIGLLMKTGIKRVDLTSPVFTVLNDGSDNTTPQLASVGTQNIVNGGFENE